MCGDGGLSPIFVWGFPPVHRLPGRVVGIFKILLELFYFKERYYLHQAAIDLKMGVLADGFCISYPPMLPDWPFCATSRGGTKWEICFPRFLVMLSCSTTMEDMAWVGRLCLVCGCWRLVGLTQGVDYMRSQKRWRVKYLLTLTMCGDGGLSPIFVWGFPPVHCLPNVVLICEENQPKWRWDGKAWLSEGCTLWKLCQASEERSVGGTCRVERSGLPHRRKRSMYNFRKFWVLVCLFFNACNVSEGGLCAHFGGKVLREMYNLIMYVL